MQVGDYVITTEHINDERGNRLIPKGTEGIIDNVGGFLPRTYEVRYSNGQAMNQTSTALKRTSTKNPLLAR